MAHDCGLRYLPCAGVESQQWVNLDLSKWMALGIQLYLGVRSLTACFLLRLQWQSHQSQFAYLPDTSICPAVWQPVCEFLSPLQWVEFA